MPNKLEKSQHHTNNSAYREKLIEHLFVAELLKISWLHHGCSLEISKPEVDNAGYDLIAEMPGCIRHIQLKTTVRGGKAAYQKVHSKLAKKPSGCVVWIYFDENTLKLGPFYYFAAEDKSLVDCKIAAHTKGNSKGEKAKRPNIRIIPKGGFEKFESIGDLFDQLFQADISKTVAAQPTPSPEMKQPKKTVAVLPIALNPPGSEEFKNRLLQSKRAKIEITYSDGTTKVKDWNVRDLNERSNIISNLRGRPEFRSGKWQENGIERVTVRVNE
jgi:hypothetical protein